MGWRASFVEITRDEFYRAVRELKADLREDIQAVVSRLDGLNGRTGKNEVEIGVLNTRVDLAEHEVFRRRRDQEDSGAISVRSKRQTRNGTGEAWAEERITPREKALIGFGLVILSATLKVLELVGTKLWHVLMSKP